jgi:hypothetical protein
MKALKKASFGLLFLGVLGTVVLGSYNSMFISNDAFMNQTAGIKFTKRLDEISGKVVIGRMAASSSPWTALNKKAQKKVAKAKKAIVKGNYKKAERKLRKALKKVAKKIDMPTPAIQGDLDLSLSNVFHKKPLKAGSFSGSAKTVDGVIEEIYVSLPNGRTIEINTNERMMGNVFQYEDTKTREMQSGMFYEVKKGTYMITLTSDSQYKGTRLEFKASETEVAYNDDHYSAQESWEMDQQNEQKELAQEDTQQLDQNNNEEQPTEYAQGVPSESYGFDLGSQNS